jgi:uncharacterized protein
MSPLPREGELVIRRIPFEFPDDLNPIWHPHHEWSQMVNGASLTMPYLEPFLIASLREAVQQIDDPHIREEAAGFCAQETTHFKTHRRYNELLKANGYPVLAGIEADIRESFIKLGQKSLSYRLAYACGFETMTLGVTNWLVSNRRKLFGGSDTRVASFILWHFVEEAEHKRVAIDVYRAVDGNYWTRLAGIAIGSFDVFWWSRKAAIAMLKTDGRWNNLPSRIRLWRRTGEFFLAIFPVLIRSAVPGHQAEDEKDPAWVRDWINGYALRPDDSVPLVDTSDPDIPVPFGHAGAV